MQREMVDLQDDPDYHEQSNTLLNVPRRETIGGGWREGIEGDDGEREESVSTEREDSESISLICSLSLSVLSE